MKFPACSHELTQIKVGDLAVDVCLDRCGGIWFDNRELQRVDEATELDLQPYLDICLDLSVELDYSARRHCPRCAEVFLMRQGYAGHREIQVDTCANCGGIWLDSGELAQIRENSKEAAPAGGRQEYFGQFVRHQRDRVR